MVRGEQHFQNGLAGVHVDELIDALDRQKEMSFLRDLRHPVSAANAGDDAALTGVISTTKPVS